ncbi:hypothetical protein LMG19083_04575 [Ralstonia psammae]|uniref:Transmembrane protein n=1 Tax=Ralstonia psammae TaxID=3058598 RepID=A0ABN9JGL8_9RALS|nr:hypothetical protein [Ralstonia sp. LMG 19083]CAJ0807522.1 hypothetical protein LMG19083_04575 [Ralstonia sp. LMG 19083]
MKISKGATIKAAYRSAFQIPLRHPLLTVLTTVGLLMLTVAGTNGEFRPWFFITLLMMAQTLVTVPLQVAGYRLLLRRETNNHAWSLQTVAFCVLAVFLGAGFMLIAKLRLMLGLIGAVGQFGLYYLYYRLILALPALATDAGRAALRLSWDATAGQVWSVFVVMTAGTAPIIVASVLMLTTGQVSMLGVPQTPIGSVLQAATAVISTFLVVGTISAVYQNLLGASEFRGGPGEVAPSDALPLG